MSCNNPFLARYQSAEARAYESSLKFENFRPDKGKIKILGSAKRLLPKDERFYDWQMSDEAAAQYGILDGSEMMLIPCGKCLGCRVDRARQWGARAYLESIGKTGNYFVTLTVSPEAMEILGEDVRPDMIAMFMKRFRKHHGDGIRFFACGEYGKEHHRAHYHILLYGTPLSLDDMTLLGRNNLGDAWYRSEAIEECWWIPSVDPETGEVIRLSIGNCSVSPLSVNTCAYTARYCSKKQDDKFLDELVRNNRKLPFLQMSRRPGIASEWIDQHLEEVFDPEGDGKVSLGKDQRLAPPRYFRDRADKRGIDRTPLIERSKVASRKHLESVMANTSYDEAEFWTIRELNLAEKNLKWIRQIE